VPDVLLDCVGILVVLRLDFSNACFPGKIVRSSDCES
jgi:hypothetical protein